MTWTLATSCSTAELYLQKRSADDRRVLDASFYFMPCGTLTAWDGWDSTPIDLRPKPALYSELRPADSIKFSFR